MRKTGVLICLLLFCLAGTVRAEDYYTKGYIQSKQQVGVILYAEDNADSQMLACFLPGAPVTVIAHQGSWYLVHLGHEEDADMLTGYVLASQVSSQAPAEALPRTEIAGGEQVALDTQGKCILLGMLEPGQEVEVLGRGMQCWFVRAGEKVGTVGASSINAGANLEGRLEEGYYAYLTQAEANWQALNSFLEEANSQYSADQRVWPLEVRHEYDLLEVKCGVIDPWVDELPNANELEQSEALALAKDYFRELLGIDIEQEEWQIFIAFGYNRMEPKVRLWQFTFQKKNTEGYDFRMQLAADTGELYRTSNATDFLQSLRTDEYTIEDAFHDTQKEWEEQLGRDMMEWSIEERYAFANLPVCKVVGFDSQATIPQEWEIPMEEALSTAKLGLMHRYGLEETQLDGWRLETKAAEIPPSRLYQFSWYRWKEEEALWECLYTAHVDMRTGKIVVLVGPGEGNG